MRETPRAKIVAPQNLLDRVITYFAPRVAQRRVMARVQLAVAGGYSGARIDKAALASWRTSAGSPDSDVIPDLPTLRQRAADLERNAPVGATIINTSAIHTVGTGLACNPQIDGAFLGLTEEQVKEWQADTKRRFNAWAVTPDCDLARKLNLYGIQDLALRSTNQDCPLVILSPASPAPATTPPPFAVAMPRATTPASARPDFRGGGLPQACAAVAGPRGGGGRSHGGVLERGLRI